MDGMKRAIGLMSGTSMDGVDAALLETDGERIGRLGPALTMPYDAGMRARIRGVLGGRGDLDGVAADHARRHAEAVAELCRRHGLAAADVDRMAATARRSDLSGAIADLAERYRDEQLAGVVVISDGGDTAPRESDSALALRAPVVAVGVGDPSVARDREIVNLTAGDPLLTGPSIDLSVSAVSAGCGTEPAEIRVATNGRPVDVRRLTPAAPGAP